MYVDVVVSSNGDLQGTPSFSIRQQEAKS